MQNVGKNLEDGVGFNPRRFPNALPSLSGVAVAAALSFAVQASAQEASQAAPEDRKAFFGEQHIHTSWSVDAWLFGNHTTGPDDALSYARGATIKHPLGYDITIDKPLDWMGVTDHSEYVGITKQANTPGSSVSKMPQAKPLILADPNDPADVEKVFNYLVSLVSKPPIKAFMTPEVAGSVWKDNIDIANQHNKPGEFTAFCAYEFTSQYDMRNLHRNVYFRDCAKVPEQPYSALFSWHPEDLWKWMDEQRAAGNELLAISHNANLSDGWMYPTDVDSLGRPIDEAYAESRMRNERLIEIKQIKGQSETHPLLSPNDEFANYEIASFLIGQPEDSGRVAAIVGSYARQALKDGLTMQDARGYNPFKFGFVGGSDSHNTGAPYRTNNAYAGHGINDGLVQRRLSGHLFTGMDVRTESTAGLSGVWADENTRESLWDAMHRRETFGTSGVWIQVRLFGGWDYSDDLTNDADWVALAYAGGTPMGGDLPAAPSGATAPTFVVWAAKDPDFGSLDRIQIVKGWTKDGQSFEKVYDVVWSGDREPEPNTGQVPPLPSTVDLTTATYTNEHGATELIKVWTDPDFDSDLHAFYYARVLEIPTPRWTTVQAVRLGVDIPDVVPATVQERAWSSPIWYAPATDRTAASDVVTVASLEESGAAALTDDELKALIVGKAIWVRNNVTGEVMKVHYDTSGTFDVNYVGDRALRPSLTGNLAQDSYLAIAKPYTIANDQISTFVSSTPIGMKVYKVAGTQGGSTQKQHATYYGARSNEFGYANYEILLAGPGNLVELPKNKMDIPTDEQPSYLHLDIEN